MVNKNVKLVLMLVGSIIIGVVGFFVWLGLYSALSSTKVGSVLDVIMLLVVVLVDYAIFKYVFLEEYRYTPDYMVQNTSLGLSLLGYLVALFIHTG